MRPLTFSPVPAGSLPLFIGEPREDVSAQGLLRCDHATGVVYFVPADPLCPRRAVSDPAALTRYSTWEVDAMMPRRQIRAIYDHVRPLIEQLHAGVTLRFAPEGWARSQTPEADIAYECVDEALCVEVEPEMAWVPALWRQPIRSLEQQEDKAQRVREFSAALAWVSEARQKICDISAYANDTHMMPIDEWASFALRNPDHSLVLAESVASIRTIKDPANRMRRLDFYRKFLMTNNVTHRMREERKQRLGLLVG